MTTPQRGYTPSRAVALTYHDNDPAPRVVAQGRGITAEAIIEKARAAGIYIHESPELVGLLMQVNLDSRIPESLYTAIAELLAWIYQLEQRAAPNGHTEIAGKGG